jgi:hypothetical protein
LKTVSAIDFLQNTRGRESVYGIKREGLCSVTRAAGYLFPGLFVDFIDIFGEGEFSAAIHAAQCHAASTEGKR